MSTKYRKVSVSMWADEKFNGLSAPLPNAQTLWLALLTGPRTTCIPGVVIARPAALAADLGWDDDATPEVAAQFRKGFGKGLRKGFGDAFQELHDAGMVKSDPKAGLVWLPRAVYHNHPNNPNVLISWGRFWPEVPECQLRTELLGQLAAFVPGIDAKSKNPEAKAFTKAFQKAFAKWLPESFAQPVATQDQEQEQDLKDPEKIFTSAGGTGHRAPDSAPAGMPDYPPLPDEPPHGAIPEPRQPFRRQEPPRYDRPNGATVAGSVTSPRLCARCGREGGSTVLEAGKNICRACYEKRPTADADARAAALELARRFGGGPLLADGEKP